GPLFHLVEVPAVLGAHDPDMGVPSGFVRGATAWEAVDDQVTHLLVAKAVDAVPSARRDAYQVAWLQLTLVGSVGSDLEPAAPGQHIEDLLGVVVLVKGRRLTRLHDGDEALARGRVGPVHHQFVGVGREAVTAGGCRRVDVLHWLLPEVVPRVGTGLNCSRSSGCGSWIGRWSSVVNAQSSSRRCSAARRSA